MIEHQIHRTKHKTYLMVKPCSISWHYITKQLEYVTKYHLAAHTILFKLKTALFFGITV